MADRLAVDRHPGTSLGDSALLPYRYAPRPVNGAVVERTQLLRNLTKASLLKQLSTIRGPAGSGKTLLLGQWHGLCHDMDRPVAWLTLDRGDSDPGRFIAGLATAVAHAGLKDIAGRIASLRAEGGTCSIIELGHRLAAIFNSVGKTLIIILDQFEKADSEAIGALLGLILDHAVSVRLVIASRKHLTLPVAGHRARDQVFELLPADLNLTPAETHALFDGLPELYARRIHLETSGEAVALGFAKRAMEVPPFDFADADDWREQLYEYYRAEVLDALPLDMREAVSRLVVVERFDQSLATALIGRHATDVMERLHRIDGILLRHRGSREFFLPEMLRRFLETRLAWLGEDELQSVHRRAASWFANRNRNAEALRHAVEAGDRDQASRLLEKVGYASLVVQHGVAAAHELLEAVGMTPGTASVDQYLSLAVIYAHEGNRAEAARQLEQAKAIARSGGTPDPASDGQFALTAAVVAGISDDVDYAQRAPALAQFLASGPQDDHEKRGQAYVFLSYDKFRQGDLDGAEHLIALAAAEYAETDAVFGSLFLHVHRILHLYWRNELEEALGEAQLAQHAARIFFPDDQRLCAMASMLRAGLLLELGRPDHATDLTHLVGTVGALESWSEIQIWCHVHAARAAFARGEISEARGIIAFGLDVAKRLDAPRLDWVLQLLGADIALEAGERDRAQQAGAALGIASRQGLAVLPAFLTWQERIEGALVGARLASARRDFAGAGDLLGAARDMIAAQSSARCKVKLEIAAARLADDRGDPDLAASHFAAARGLCRNGVPMRLFLDAGAGLGAVQPEVATRPARPPADRRTSGDDPLTARERQILMLLGEGHQNKVAAHRLGLSEATVKFHLRNIYRKLQAQNRTQALARYRMFGDAG